MSTTVGETTTKDTMMDKKTYDLLMEQGAAGTNLAADAFDELAAFAKAKRLRRPDPAWRLAEPADAAEPNARRGVNKGKTCSAEGCGKDAYCKGRCAAHYASDRRLDPAEREKAREASRRSYAKRKSSAEAAK
ncbi:hypothetical protein FXB39_10340 [Nocardioides sp. BGMRC 2183]|nr:hypothetical protein FXB39_10340 [Nocardioides sp. BGMRC 2183]